MADLIGLRVRDRTTQLLTLDVTDRLTRIMGVVNSGSTAGSLVIPALGTGAGWAAVIESQAAAQSPANMFAFPIVTVSGSTLSWYFPSYPGQTFVIVPCDILYGVY